MSICIPTYNHAQFIEASLRSAMAQTYEDLEILVIDNASEDDTQNIVSSISSQDRRITYIRQPINIGLVGNLNACIELARGKYVKVLCADDSLQPECVAAMAKALDEHPEVTLVGCTRMIADPSLSVTRTARSTKKTAKIAGKKMISHCFFFGNRIGEPTAVMFRKAQSSRGFSQEYPQLTDMEMWFHLLAAGDFLSLSQPLCTIRLHETQATWDNDSKGRIVADRQKLFNQFSASVGDSSKLFKRFLWDVRMAYAVLRSVASGMVIRNEISEVYFPRTFSLITFPLVKVLRKLGLGSIWKTP